MSEQIIIDHRFRGPPTSGNGGYVCGVMAERLGPAAEITLMAPPPVETPLDLRSGEGGVLDLWHGETRVASGVAIDGADIAVPPAVDPARAGEAAARTPFDTGNHPLPSCFVCSPRRHEDGLCIHVGAVNPGHAADLMAARWIPPAEFADETGRIHGPLVWAALDCPSGYVVHQYGQAEDGTDALALLGRLRAVVHERPRVGETCVITARCRERDGRKLFSQVALYGEGDRLLAAGQAVWIALPPEVAAKLR